jgi:hypothetical protein
MSYEPDIRGDLAIHKRGGKEPHGSWSNKSGYSCNKDPRIHGNVGTKIDVTADLPPPRHELFLLDDDEKKVEFEPETRKSSTITLPGLC